jgi:pimeloyl-ACP methyl ester carboxylesterase
MNLSLQQFLTTDSIRLSGLLYHPKDETDHIALFLHGCGSADIFYSADRTNTFGKAFTDKGIAFFSFNNRGAHIVRSLKQITKNSEDRVLYGTAYELIRECEYDIDGAIQMLKRLGYSRFSLVGHSTGANKIVIYDIYAKHNSITNYILLAGGDDTGLYYKEFGKNVFFDVLERSFQKICAGKGKNLVPKYILDRPMSYQSLYDTINPDGDYNCFPYISSFEKIPNIAPMGFWKIQQLSKRSLLVYGSEDLATGTPFYYTKEILNNIQKHNPNLQMHFLENADHNFTRQEETLGTYMADWLANTP